VYVRRQGNSIIILERRKEKEEEEEDKMICSDILAMDHRSENQRFFALCHV